MVQNNSGTGLYILKHKDLDVAMVLIDLESGKIDYILDVYFSDELPVGCEKDGLELAKWWESRAIPDSRKGIQQVLTRLGERTNLSLMLSAYGLSLNDHYWMQPIGTEIYWKDINFYQNSFSDELGDLLTDSYKINIDLNISKFSPSSSVTGEMKKKWIIRNGIRYLMKVNANDYGQQAVNEVIACRLHQRLGWKHYVQYEIETVILEEEEVPCSINPLFTSDKIEFVSAYQLIRNEKIQNDSSVYEAIIVKAVALGADESEVRKQLEYTILTDFILTNTDRHFNNFGFLYDPVKHKIIGMAPIFDTGNILFYDKEFIPAKDNLLEINAASFSNKEVRMLKYVENREMFHLDKLQGFSDEVKEMLVKHTKMPEKRAEAIARTVDDKIEFLRMFQNGADLWKPKKYWQVTA